jgi:hypothetical protein
LIEDRGGEIQALADVLYAEEIFADLRVDIGEHGYSQIISPLVLIVDNGSSCLNSTISAISVFSHTPSCAFDDAPTKQ